LSGWRAYQKLASDGRLVASEWLATMPRYFSYIGKLDCPGFFWNDLPDQNFRTGNTPEKIIPRKFSLGLGFPPEAIDYWAKKLGTEGKQIDWAGWGVIVSKADLQTIWKRVEGRRLEGEEQWPDIWNAIEMLDESQKYVLVVAEEP
jgi:hypothetical protein